MIIGLIPSRLNSKRLNRKPLLEINNLPIIVHTFKRAKLAKKIDKLVVCTDSKEIQKIVKKHGGESLLTSKNHKNGTERIYEIAKKFNAKLIVDIQGDEPLLDPLHIDKVIQFHLKNLKYDIILPTLKFKNPETKNVVKVVSSKNKVLYLSRSVIPFSYKSKPKYYKKHLSIISFKPKALKTYCQSKETELEKIEGIELLRALENNLSIGTFSMVSNTFSVDIKEDYLRAIEAFKKDKYRNAY
jgi:3-deoxy-manno-octulosonate cytidylyltransferase (CMP-KDO synthetase)